MNVLAHPLIQPGGLPLPPVVVAVLAVQVVALAAAWRPRSPRRNGSPAGRAAPDTAAPAALPGRVIGVILLGLAIATGLWGRNVVTENLAPALVLGVGWPLLVALSVLGLRVWERMNPWDTLATALAWLTGTDDRVEPPGSGTTSAIPAILPAIGFGWYLSAYRDALVPRSLGTALAVYTLVTLAACLVMGRRAWLARGEVITLVLGWFTRVRRAGLVGWAPPSGATSVLGVVSGAFVFTMLRDSTLLGPLVFGLRGIPAETVGFTLSAIVAVAALAAAERRCAGAGFPGSAVAAAVPVVAGLALAAAMARGQLLLAAQVLPRVAGDPFGRGWDPFGTAGWVVRPNPLGDTVHSLVQVLLLVAGGVVGALVARARTPATPGQSGPARRARTAAVAGAAALMVAGILAATAA